MFLFSSRPVSGGRNGPRTAICALHRCEPTTRKRMMPTFLGVIVTVATPFLSVRAIVFTPAP